MSIEKDLREAIGRLGPLQSARALRLGVPGQPISVKLSSGQCISARCGSVINSSRVTVAKDQNGKWWVFCASAPRSGLRRTGEFLKSKAKVQQKEAVGETIKVLCYQTVGSNYEFLIVTAYPELKVTSIGTIPIPNFLHVIYGNYLQNKGAGDEDWDAGIFLAIEKGGSQIDDQILAYDFSRGIVLDSALNVEARGFTETPLYAHGWFSGTVANQFFPGTLTRSTSYFDGVYYSSPLTVTSPSFGVLVVEGSNYIYPPNVTRPFRREQPIGSNSFEWRPQYWDIETGNAILVFLQSTPAPPYPDLVTYVLKNETEEYLIYSTDTEYQSPGVLKDTYKVLFDRFSTNFTKNTFWHVKLPTLPDWDIVQNCELWDVPLSTALQDPSKRPITLEAIGSVVDVNSGGILAISYHPGA